MFTRLASVLIAASLLAACSSTPDRYAFWRDSSPAESKGAPPNLGNIPAAPDTQTAQAEMESMRQRLEIERQNSFRAVQGLPPLPVPGEAQPVVAANGVASDELSPAPVMASTTQIMDAQPVMPQQTWQTGSVQYNYAPQQDYVYGNSNYQFKQQMANMPPATPQLVSNDPSISIDMSALNGAPVMSMSPMSLSGGRTLAYFGHGSSSIDRTTRNQISEIAKQLQNSNASVVLVGHASQRTGINDPITSQAVNLRMASKRAETVMRELSRQGVPASKVKITALGDSQANPHSQGKSQEQADRRVDILFD
jgi:outer membrane protein OmpA-like peptidoglycan-associated protein